MSETHTTIDEELANASAPCVTASFQAESIVLLHMLIQRQPTIPVLFLDTFHHFPEVMAYREAISERWGLQLITLKATAPSPGLWQTDTSACCARHKVEPLFAALQHYDAWFTGLRREQSPSRASVAKVEPFALPSGHRLKRVSPLASWTTRDVWSYAKSHDLPLLSLYEAGYTSIGCEPCTSLPDDPANPRSGRWRGQKLECGIHIQSAGAGHHTDADS